MSGPTGFTGAAFLLLLTARPARAQYEPGTVPEDAAGLIRWSQAAREQPPSDRLHLAEAYAYLVTGAHVEGLAAVARIEASADREVRLDALRLRAEILARRPDTHREALALFDQWLEQRPGMDDPALAGVEGARLWLRAEIERSESIRAHAGRARRLPLLALFGCALLAYLGRRWVPFPQS